MCLFFCFSIHSYGSFFKSESPDEAVDILLFLAIVSAGLGLMAIPTTRLVGPRETIAVTPAQMKCVVKLRRCHLFVV